MAGQEAENILIAVDRRIREHYTKLTNTYQAKCNYCNAKFSLQKNYLSNLHKHLMEKHSEKLKEEQKQEDKLHWIWNYFIPESDTEAICKKCNSTIKYQIVNELRSHLKRLHKYVYFK